MCELQICRGVYVEKRLTGVSKHNRMTMMALPVLHPALAGQQIFVQAVGQPCMNKHEQGLRPI